MLSESLDLDAIKARLAAATPGPWGWRGNSDGAIELRTLHSVGLRVITTMRAQPCGVESDDGEIVLAAEACAPCRGNHAKYMAGEDLDDAERCAKPENLNTVWLWDNGFVSPANKWAVNERTYRTDIARVEHPDAELVANAPTDIAALVAEVERLRSAVSEARGCLIEAEGWVDSGYEAASLISDALRLLP